MWAWRKNNLQMCIMFMTMENVGTFILDERQESQDAMLLLLWWPDCGQMSVIHTIHYGTHLDPENKVGYATHTGLDMRGDSTLGIITAKRRETGKRGVDGLVEECGSLWLLSKTVGDITAQGRGWGIVQDWWSYVGWVHLCGWTIVERSRWSIPVDLFPRMPSLTSFLCSFSMACTTFSQVRSFITV